MANLMANDIMANLYLNQKSTWRIMFMAIRVTAIVELSCDFFLIVYGGCDNCISIILNCEK